MQMQVIVDRLLRNDKMNYLNINEKTLIYFIGSFMGNKMISWPSNKELARVMSVSIKTVQRTIKSLEQKNILIVKRSYRQNNVYSFNPSWLALFKELNVPVGELGRYDENFSSEGIDKNEKMKQCDNKSYIKRHKGYIRATKSRTNNINNNINNNYKSYPQAENYKPAKTADKPSELLLRFKKGNEYLN